MFYLWQLSCSLAMPFFFCENIPIIAALRCMVPPVSMSTSWHSRRHAKRSVRTEWYTDESLLQNPTLNGQTISKGQKREALALAREQLRLVFIHLGSHLYVLFFHEREGVKTIHGAKEEIWKSIFVRNLTLVDRPLQSCVVNVLRPVLILYSYQKCQETTCIS